MTEQFYRTFLEQLLDIDCTTGSELEIGNVWKSYFEKNGDKVVVQEVEPNRNNIWAFDKNPQKEKRVLFTSHIDTVPPHLEWRHDTETDCYYGRGACDTKGGQITEIMAGQELRAEGYAIDYLWVVGEEVNHIGAIKAVEYYNNEFSDIKYEMIILMEPTDNRLSKGQKGILSFTADFKGKMAHSGYPHLGDDANKKMISFASELYKTGDELKDEAYGDFDVNIGKIEAGHAANVISSKAHIKCLSRTNTNHSEFKKKLESLLNDDIDLKIMSDNPPMAFDHVEKLGYENTYVAKFNTDVKFLNNIAPVYLMGPGYIIHAHAPGEHIFWKDMMIGKDLYKKLVKDVLK